MSSARRSAISMLLGQGAQTVLLGVQFIVLARLLGPEEFGRVAGVIAFTVALLPFSGMGMGNVAVMKIARGQLKPDLALGNAVAMTAVTGVIACVIAIAACVWLLGRQTLPVIGFFAVSELLATKLIDIAAHVQYGLEQHARGTAFYTLHCAIRLACTPLLLVVPHADAVAWAALHLLGGVVTLAFVAVASWRRVGRPRVDWAQAWLDSRSGFFFSLNLSARGVQVDNDKAILARVGDLSTVGAYTAAFRVVAMSYMPVVAIVLSAQARLFRSASEGGVSKTLKAARPLALAGVAYGILLAAAFFSCAQFLPLLLGEKFAPSIPALQALSLYPLVMVLKLLVIETVISVDGPHIASACQVAGAALSIGMNLVLIPIMSWQGAVITAYVSQAVMAATLMLRLWWVARTQAAHIAPAAP